MERHTGIPMGQPYSTVLISPPIMRLSSLSRPLSHSRTGSVPEAVLKNRAGSIFSESFMPMLYHIWYSMASARLHCNKGRDAVPVAVRCGLQRHTLQEHRSYGVGRPDEL